MSAGMGAFVPRQATVGEMSEQLEKEEEWVRRTEARLEKSRELREGMTGILDGFEAHLDRLNSTVDPLYQNTRKLQTRQSNITKVLKTVGTRIDFYSIADEMDSTIRDSDPEHDLKRYLKNMEKLLKAIDFFGQDSHNAVQLDNVRSSFEAGCQALERYFKDTTRRTVSQALGPGAILDAVDDDYEVRPGRLRPESLAAASDIATLAQLSDWLRARTARSDFLTAFADARCTAMLKALQGVLNSRKTSTLTAAAIPKHSVGVSPKTERKASGMPRRKFSRAVASALSEGGGGSYRRANTMGLEALVEESGDRDAETFLLLVVAFRALLQAETMLLKAVVKSARLEAALFPRLVVKPFAFVLDQAKFPITTIRRLLNRGDFGCVLSLCPVSHYLHTHDDALSTLAKNGDGLLAEKYPTVVDEIDKLTDVDKLVPRDGTVHERTSNTVALMKQLLEERESISPLLAAADAAADKGALPKLFARILSSLGLNLRTKGNSYADKQHQELFMLNNFNHILKTLTSSGILAVVREQNPQVGTYYEEQVSKYFEDYVREWGILASALGEFAEQVPSGAMQLAESEKKKVKAAFSAWNAGLEALHASAEGMSVPDSDLAARLRREIKEPLAHRYNAFYNAFKSSNFTKNPEKYVKYLPETVSSLIDHLFDGHVA